MSIPVIFIHKGNSDYLFYTLYQLRHSNPAADIYLIGTKDLKIYSPLAKCLDISDYMQEADKLTKIYQHHSTNPPDYELFCIQRWFILKAFFLKHGIEKGLYLDSDILFYSNVDEVAKKFEYFGMTISEISGHTNFVEIKVLTDFCDYVIDCYSRKDSAILLQQFHNEFVEKYNSGISDMTFLASYYRTFPEKVFNYFRWTSTEILDHTLNNTEGWDDRFIMQDKYIKVVWKNYKPYFIRKQDNEVVLTHSLHFQGDSKSIMIRYIPVKSIKFYYSRLLIKAYRLLQKVLPR